MSDLVFNTLKLDATSDPAKSHRLYYTIMRTMIDNLPKGKDKEKKVKRLYLL